MKTKNHSICTVNKTKAFFFSITKMLLQSFYKPILTNVIIPHGITDIVHAKLYGNTQSLMQIYGCTTFLSIVSMPFDKAHIVHPLFLLASAIHFRTDMLTNNNFVQFLQSIAFVIYFQITDNYDIFLLYMLCLHVPKHYLDAWKYLRQDKWTTTLSLFCVRLATFIFEQYIDLQTVKHIPLIVQFTVIGHIVYTELFVRNKFLLDQK